MSYWFKVYPEPLVPVAVKLVIAALAVGVVVSIALYLAGRLLRHNPPKKRAIMRFFQWCMTASGITLLLFFFRQQRAYFLAMPAVAIVVHLGLIAWLVHIIIGVMKRLPEEERKWREIEERKKYLPNSK